MRSHPSVIAPLRILGLRALLAYPLVRLLIAVVAAIVGEFAGAGAAAGFESPLGVVLIATALGAIDIQRRGESILWADLGYSPLVAPGLFGAVAVVGELVLAWFLA